MIEFTKTQDTDKCILKKSESQTFAASNTSQWNLKNLGIYSDIHTGDESRNAEPE
jgi:hypothetical protein